MATGCISSTTLIVRDFLVQHGLCDLQQARQLASKFDWELRQCEVIETEDGTSFTRDDRRGGRGGNHCRQLGF
jgi:hypothetical protein